MYRLVVNNLGSDVSDEKVVNLFLPFGEVKVERCKEDTKLEVIFQNLLEAKRAISGVNGMKFRDTELEVKWSDDTFRSQVENYSHRYSTFIATDKQKYKPGETCHVRVTILNTYDNTPILEEFYTHSDFLIDIVGPDGSTKFGGGELNITFKNGIVAFSYPIEKNCSGGEHTIRVSMKLYKKIFQNLESLEKCQTQEIFTISDPSVLQVIDQRTVKHIGVKNMIGYVCFPVNTKRNDVVRVRVDENDADCTFPESLQLGVGNKHTTRFGQTLCTKFSKDFCTMPEGWDGNRDGNPIKGRVYEYRFTSEEEDKSIEIYCDGKLYSIVDAKITDFKDPHFYVFFHNHDQQVTFLTELPRSFICSLSSRKFDIETTRKQPKYRKRIMFKKEGYGAKDKVTALLIVERSEGGVPPPVIEIHAKAKLDGHFILDEKYTTKNNGKQKIEFILPEVIQNTKSTLSCSIREPNGVVENTSKTIPILEKSIDVKFYPEGGELITGVECGVYFMVRSKIGEIVDFTGVLIERYKIGGDEEEVVKPLQMIKTQHEGRGFFSITPKEGMEYYIRVIDPSNITEFCYLPKPKNTGCSLRYSFISSSEQQQQRKEEEEEEEEEGEEEEEEQQQQQKNKQKNIKVMLRSTEKMRVKVVLYRKEQTIYESKILLLLQEEEKEVILKNYPDLFGVMRITVYFVHPSFGITGLNFPICERLIFIPPPQKIRYSIETDRQKYSPGDEVKLKIKPYIIIEKKKKKKKKKITMCSTFVCVTVTDNSEYEMIEKRRRNPMLEEMVFLETEVDEFLDCCSYLYEDRRDKKNSEEKELIFGKQARTPSSRICRDLLLGCQGWRRFVYKYAKKEEDLLFFKSHEFYKDKKDDLFFKILGIPDITNMMNDSSGKYKPHFCEQYNIFTPPLSPTWVKRPVGIATPSLFGRTISSPLSRPIGGRGLITGMPGIGLVGRGRVRSRGLIKTGGSRGGRSSKARSSILEALQRRRQTRTGYSSPPEQEGQQASKTEEDERKKRLREEELARKKEELKEKLQRKREELKKEIERKREEKRKSKEKMSEKREIIEVAKLEKVEEEESESSEEEEMSADEVGGCLEEEEEEEETSEQQEETSKQEEEQERKREEQERKREEEERKRVEEREKRKRSEEREKRKREVQERKREVQERKRVEEREKRKRSEESRKRKSEEERRYSQRRQQEEERERREVEREYRRRYEMEKRRREEKLRKKRIELEKKKREEEEKKRIMEMMKKFQYVREYCHQRKKSSNQDEKSRDDFTPTVYFCSEKMVGKRCEESDESDESDGDQQEYFTEFKFSLNDNITQFRVFVDGFDTNGNIGSSNDTLIRSVKSFSVDPKIPLEMTNIDRPLIPVGIFNNLDEAGTVRLDLEVDHPQIKINPKKKSISLQARERKVEYYELEISSFVVHDNDDEKEGKMGNAVLKYKSFEESKEAKFEAIGIFNETLRDRVTKRTTLVPYGFDEVQSFSGSIDPTHPSHKYTIQLPDREKNLIPYTLSTESSVSPQPIGLLLNSVKSLISIPGGCLEQVCSRLYPMTMASHLIHNSSNPVLDQRTLETLNEGMKSGYQKIAGYEVSHADKKGKRGFDWYGKHPPNETLTALSICQLLAMRGVYAAVDQGLIERAFQWLTSERRDQENGGFLRGYGRYQYGHASKDICDSYILWAISKMKKDERWRDSSLKLNEHESSDNEHLMKLVKKYSKEEEEEEVDCYILSLISLTWFNQGMEEESLDLVKKMVKFVGEDGCCEKAESSITRSGGYNLWLETTSLLCAACMNFGDTFSSEITKMISYILSKNSNGRFGSTQATVLCLEVLVKYFSSEVDLVTSPKVGIKLNGEACQDMLVLPKGNSLKKGSFELPVFGKDLMKLSKENVNGSTIDLEIYSEDLGYTLPYTMNIMYKVAIPKSEPSNLSFEFFQKLESTEIQEGENVELEINLKNKRKEETLPMIIAKVNLPSGLEPRIKSIKEMKEAGKFSYFELFGARCIVFYWTGMEKGSEVSFKIDLNAAIPGEYVGAPSEVYLYYNEDEKLFVEGLKVMIRS